MPMSKRDPNDKRRYVIVGGGPAAVSCALTLRQSGYTGELVMISSEEIPPYDRTLLTKVLPFGDARRFALRSDDVYKNHDIDIKYKANVTAVNSKDK